ncbi:geranyltranstransferase [Candidatus Protochlamydia naegleriophila]|uniref:Geranyltranstransferase n=1 Tax=Candidatus Protochlamydia naegleriophila TaxID=389348 RepID=A0A0U5J6G8_9BACT|nr:polyprenyl synthetase family protein [Candidatus Protochlamydia naegleriophila]CUI15641.1 geranyltranstransferase [Candidatus Protochlamydia naegleriophila]
MQITRPSFSSILEPYKRQIEELIQANIATLGSKTLLRDACEYALLNGGKRFRPALVLMIAKALNFQVDVSQAALGVEYFHTASLIADDLPCMDNDDERRNKPALHKVYGESVALLATYALIAAGYQCLARNAASLAGSAHPFANQSDRLCVLALENATHNTGILGATGGQFLDLTPPDLSLSTLREVIDKKTVTLFEISFVFGWIFGGGDLEQLPLVKKSAAHFGMAFQVADDLGDMAQDLSHEHTMNFANVYGKDSAVALFHEEIEQFKQTLQELSLSSEELQALSALLIEQVNHLA